MSVTTLLPRPAERDFMYNRHIIPDDRRIPDDDARPTVDEHARPDRRRRVNVDREARLDTPLQKKGKTNAVMFP